MGMTERDRNIDEMPVPKTAASLQYKIFGPVRWVIPGFIVEGATLLAGPPKHKKSWWVLNGSVAVASGGECYGEKCIQGDVLHISLEDNDRRFKSRLKSLLGKKPWPRALEYVTECPRANEGGLDFIRRWLEKHPKARLVVVDVLQLFRSPSGNSAQSKYEADYNAVKGLQRIAGKYRVAIIIVHHTRKSAGEDPFDEVSGTQGLSGGVDAVLVMRRAPWGATLFGRGRDMEDDIDVGMKWSKITCRWIVLGNTSDVRRTNQRRKILEAVKDYPLKPREIAEITEMKGGNVRQLLLKMLADGELVKNAQGEYLADNTITER